MNSTGYVADIFIGKRTEGIVHDDNACKAYIEYMENEVNNKWVNHQGIRRLPKGQRIDDVAKKYGTSKFQMKKHWMCYERLKNKVS